MKSTPKKKKQGKEVREYVTLDKILAAEALYNILYGKRSNGKSYAVMNEMLTDYWVFGKEFAIIRRHETDFQGVNGASMFDGLANNSVITDLTGGEWTGVSYFSRRWYLSRFDEEKRKIVRAETPMGYAFALTQAEHYKSTAFPRIKNILFDEFIANDGYLTNEFILFTNVLSTIIRDKSDVRIFMCGNTINPYNPYFKEMGLKNAKNMKPGDIQVYTYGNSGLTVAVEYTDARSSTLESNKYFAFDNPQLAMITDGDWQIQPYPHLPCKYRPMDIVFTYFIEFDDELLQCEVITVDETIFTYIHRKTTPLKDERADIIFSPKDSHFPNWRRRLSKPSTDLERRLFSFFTREKVFYQDNSVGETVRNYLMWCNTTPLL